MGWWIQIGNEYTGNNNNNITQVVVHMLISVLHNPLTAWIVIQVPPRESPG